MNEKERVLKMVEDGKLTAVDALKLLEALGNNIEAGGELVEVEKEEQKGKFLRIKILSEHDNLNFTIPLALVSMGLGMVNSFGVDVSQVEGFDKIDFNEIIKQVEDGARGKVFELKTEKESIEIFIE